MSTGKTGKYFKYAIGEIILVVIGILIAIQANNWNINRTSKIELNQSLEKLLVELNNDLLDINDQINQNNDIITSLDSCLIILKNPKNYSTSNFEAVIHNTNYTISFDINRVTFDEFSNSGKLKQLNNPSLSDSLIKYYNNIRYKKVEDALAHHVRDNIRAYTLGFDYLNFDDEFDNYDVSDFKIKKKTISDYSSDVRIVNGIRFKILLHRLIDENYKLIIPRTEYLIKTIDEELNNQ